MLMVLNIVLVFSCESTITLLQILNEIEDELGYLEVQWLQLKCKHAFNTTPIKPISTCYYLEICNAITFDSRALFKIEALIWVSFWRALKFMPFNWRVGLNPRRQSKNIGMKYKTHINLCMNYMVHASSTMWRIKNQPSNYTSCMIMPYACWLLWWFSKIQKCNSNPWIQL